MQCAVNMELSQYLHQLDQQDVEQDRREAVTQEIINALVSGKKVCPPSPRTEMPCNM